MNKWVSLNITAILTTFKYSNSEESAETWVPFVQNFRPGTLTHRIAAMAMSKNDAWVEWTKCTLYQL